LRKRPLRIDFKGTRSSEAAAVRRDGKLVPSSWEDALAKFPGVSPKFTRPMARTRLASLARTARRMKRITVGRIARASSARIISIITALRIIPAGRLAGRAGRSGKRHDGAVVRADAVLLVGHDPTEAEPAGRLADSFAIRHRGARCISSTRNPSSCCGRPGDLPRCRKAAKRRLSAGSLAAKHSSMQERSSALLRSKQHSKKRATSSSFSARS